MQELLENMPTDSVIQFGTLLLIKTEEYHFVYDLATSTSYPHWTDSPLYGMNITSYPHP